MTTIEKENLFSEMQLQTLLEAKQAEWIAEQKLLDSPAKTILIDREQMIAKLKEVDKELCKKHAEAVAAWRKAFRAYADFIKKNPGTNTFNTPGTKPASSGVLEDIRAWIRALEALDKSVKSIRFGIDELTAIFKNGGNAINQMRQLRNQYVMASGTPTFWAASSNSLSTSTLSG